MGMFDYVNYAMDCPTCGRHIAVFQTKDLGCNLDTVEPTSVANFYAYCDHCESWIEFNRRAAPSLDDYDMTVETKEQRRRDSRTPE